MKPRTPKWRIALRSSLSAWRVCRLGGLGLQCRDQMYGDAKLYAGASFTMSVLRSTAVCPHASHSTSRGQQVPRSPWNGTRKTRHLWNILNSTARPRSRSCCTRRTGHPQPRAASCAVAQSGEKTGQVHCKFRCSRRASPRDRVTIPFFSVVVKTQKSLTLTIQFPWQAAPSSMVWVSANISCPRPCR